MFLAFLKHILQKQYVHGNRAYERQVYKDCLKCSVMASVNNRSRTLVSSELCFDTLITKVKHKLGISGWDQRSSTTNAMLKSNIN